jgi:hypothetical protein
MPRRDPHGFDAASHEKHHWWRSLLFRLAVCGAVTAAAWWSSGWTGLLISLMFWGRVFAADVIDLAGVAWRGLRHEAFEPVQGRFYQFKGHRIRVLDDELLPQRWLALDDLAKALGEPMPAAALRRRQPEALSDLSDGAYLLDEAALAWLREQRSDRAGRLAQWVEREVWHPVRGRKASYVQAPGPNATRDRER